MASEYIPHIVARAWDDLASTGAVRAEALRPFVAGSWIRSQRAGVDPKDAAGKMILTQDQLGKIIEMKSDLIGVSRPFMSSLYEFVAGSGFAVIISDEFGRVMEVVGDDNALRRGALINLVPGSSWAEHHAGTNGIGTALAIAKPVQVFGKEHYCEELHQWTSSAAPIRSGGERTIGVLQISGPSSKTHLHTLGMVVATVEAIEAQLSADAKVCELIIANDNLGKMFETAAHGIVLLDAEGVIRQTNPVADRILGSGKARAPRAPFMQMVSSPRHVEEMVVSGKAFAEAEMALETANGRVQCLVSGKPIRDEHDQVRAGVISLSPMKRIAKLIGRYSGSYATFTLDDIIGKDAGLQRAMELAKIAAETDSTVLICGEAGTGKEMFAHAVHNRGKQARGPFIPMNCGAMPRDLVGRELFGYEDGAFTGAAPGGRPGRLELASGGTLFLDEIGDMPLEQQVAFHRALQDKMVTRIGGANMTEVDVRVICATSKNLQHEVARGNFRPDLYNRLNVICILLPPLRERQEDIPLLFNFFLSRAMARLELNIHKVDAEVIDHLCAYEWPGNVRELQSVAERMVNTATAGHVGLEHLPGEILQPEHSEIAPSYLGSRFSDAIPATFEQHRARIRHSAQERQREELLKVLEKHDGNITRAAEEMGVSRNTIYRRMMRLDLQR
ncbi:MAG TPA: sigma-54-dependent Fis family transcriptional regulator [Firmicutes bacterium]|nr:sigma-54-dependent Fis family transcriptional regulator [Bacillota bacterium]